MIRILYEAGIFEEEEIAFMMKIYNEVFREGENVVVYAGAASDLEHAVLLGTNLVFFDTHLVKENISEIIEKIEKIGELDKIKTHSKTKTVIEFDIGGTNFKLSYYAEDATNIGIKSYPELKNGIYAYFVKVPFPKEQRAGSLREPEFFSRVLDMIQLNGFYLERECPITFKIQPIELGFERIASGHISALSVYNEKGNLYKKVKRVENLRELVYKDYKDYTHYTLSRIS